MVRFDWTIVLAAGLLCCAPAAFAQGPAATELTPAIAALDARDPHHRPREDFAAWEALDRRAGSATPAVRLHILHGMIAAAALDEKPDVVRSLYARAEPLLAGVEGSEIASWAAVAFANSSELERADAALAVAAKLLGERDAAANALLAFARGNVAWARDQLPESVAQHKRSAELARASMAADSPRLLFLQLSYATRLYLLNHEQGSVAMRAVEDRIAALPADHPLRFAMLDALASDAYPRGRYAEALELQQQATDLGGRIFGETDPRMFPTFQNLAISLSGYGQMASAERYVRQSFAVADANVGRIPAGDLAMNHELLAFFIFAQQRTAEAEVELRRALTVLAPVPKDDIRWAHIELRLARVLSFEGKHDEAMKLAAGALTSIRAKLPDSHIMRSVNEQMAGLVLANAGHTEEAYQQLRPNAVASETRLMDMFVRERELAVVQASGQQLFNELAWLSFATGREAEGLRYAELASLSDLAVATAYLDYPEASKDAALKALLAEIGAAREAERIARRAVNSGGGDKPTDSAMVAALEKAKADVARLDSSLEERFPDYRNALRPRPQPLAVIQQQLATGDALIMPITLDGKMLIVAITREGLTWDVSEGAYNEAITWITKLRASIDGSIGAASGREPFDADVAHRLYKAIFTPKIAAAVAKKTHLIFPTDGPLSGIPPAVLVTKPVRKGEKPAWLIRRFAVSIQSSFEPVSERTRGGGQGRFAGVGDPVLGEAASGEALSRKLRSGAVDIDNLRALPSLPASVVELRAMRRAFGEAGSLLLTGADATEAKVRSSRLGDYQVLAFATHGLVSGEIRGLREPALVMTPPDKVSAGDDGLLTASEIAQLDLPVEWVILSACNTGAARESTRPNYSGLARSFRLAGARSLLLSHWAVRDDAAERLTVGTIERAAKGMSRPEALRQAQLALMDNPRVPGGANPAVWAPFVLITR